MKKFLNFLLGQTNSWNRVPDHPPDEAVLILAKSLLYETDRLTASVDGYADDSEFSQAQQYYAGVVNATLGNVLDELNALMNTPLGDRITLDALALARAQLEENGQIRNYKK